MAAVESTPFGAGSLMVAVDLLLSVALSNCAVLLLLPYPLALLLPLDSFDGGERCLLLLLDLGGVRCLYRLLLLPPLLLLPDRASA